VVRAESPEEQARAYRVITGGIFGGAIMYLARPLANWLVPGWSSGETSLPTELVSMVNNLLTLLQYLGGAVIIGGLIYGGIQLVRKTKKNA
jgi:hypothetical protein